MAIQSVYEPAFDVRNWFDVSATAGVESWFDRQWVGEEEVEPDVLFAQSVQ